MDYQGLVFSYKDLVEECETLKQYAKHFLDPETTHVLEQAKSRLQNHQQKTAAGVSLGWAISPEDPLRTKWSVGKSQPGGNSAHKVRAEFSFIWNIRPLDDAEWPNKKHFVLDGKASTVVRVMEELQNPLREECIAIWKVEVGDQNSPGTHFHVQLNDFAKSPFPKSFDVPRLPALAMSPLLAVEFAIGELFQDEWRKYAFVNGAAARTWRRIHGPRLARFLKWQADRAAEDIEGSPWMAIKIAKPRRDLLVKDVGA